MQSDLLILRNTFLHRFIPLVHGYRVDQYYREEHIKELLERVLRRFHIHRELVFIDVGAYHGEYSLIASKYVDYLIALEPCPEAFKKLYENITYSISNFKLKSRVLPLALCARDGKTILWLRGAKQSSIVRRDKAKGYVTVKCMNINTLFNYCASLVQKESIVYLKIDMEGAELGVLKSLSPSIVDPKLRGLVMLVELHGTKSRILVPLLLALRGFIIKLIDPGHILALKVK